MSSEPLIHPRRQPGVEARSWLRNRLNGLLKEAEQREETVETVPAVFAYSYPQAKARGE